MKFHFVALVALLALIGMASALEPWPVDQTCIDVATTEGRFSEIYTLRPPKLGAQVVISQNHPEGLDPDIYIRWNEAPTRNEYDYADLTAETSVSLSVPIEKERRDDGTQSMFIGIYSYEGNGTVKICYKNYQCGNRDCGAEDGAGTCDEETRVCECKTGWDGRDCRLKVSDATFKTVTPVQIAPMKPVVLKYIATEETGEIQFDVERPPTIHADIIIRARRNQVPFSNAFEFEERIRGFTDNAHIEIPARNYAPGTWYFSLETTSNSGNPFTLKATAVHNLCPNNCSDHGTCEPKGTAYECKCKDGYNLADCSYLGTLLAVNATLPVALPPYGSLGFQFDVGQNVEDSNVELVLRFESKTDCAPNCPTIYIEKSRSSKTRATETRYLAMSRQPVPKVQAIPIADANLEKGSYTATIINTHSGPVSGTINILFTPHCPKNCSGHGWCSWDGICQCYDGFHSSDCSITKKVCSERLPAKSGLGGFGVFVVVVLALVLGAVGGVFFFKFSSKGSTKRTNQQEVLSADDQYSQLT